MATTDNSEANLELGKKSNASQPVIIPKTATDLQKIKLQRLIQNFEKPVIIPERRKDKKVLEPPEFVRNVMGSSAGAGSGEFHVYRHLRRKEYTRQKFIEEKAGEEVLQEKYHQKVEENRRKAEERTAKKRAKRIKQKQKKSNAKAVIKKVRFMCD
ncbi:PRKR-interacting protein 1 homolog isoform X1 [Limulus polyphemus]|uniref:PRKR-interacting protein 1 homolog isoform X1 n=2 Tax=Limulus polyphemus TaxID=6850 RepID=A0ABM1BRJ8_LIMPO|nr:PRKR-interacting protein 1 homolog isoform X1 [Limulus polyphemus]